MPNLQTGVLASLLAAIALPVLAQTEREIPDSIEQISTHMGEMSMEIEVEDREIEDALRFEPYQQLEEMFFRDDVVYVMRHGPTDWSKLDEKNVDPTDCGNQRVMNEDGIARMRDLGALMASNDVVPSQIVVSQWCRNQQTLDAMMEGFAEIDPTIAAEMPVETDGGLNLLLSLQGSKDVTRLQELTSSWDGHPDRKGPLLLITHYTNIEEFTQFRVFEGEILILDPKRDNQVLGYLRLRSAQPDVGHFADALASPLNADEFALDMVTRYYQALNNNNAEQLEDILDERWVVHGASPSLPAQDAAGFLETLAQFSEGLSDARFDVEELHVADSVVTARGTIRGMHTGPLFGFGPTGRNIAFGAIAVHKIEDGAIVESWQMADRLTLIEQLQ